MNQTQTNTAQQTWLQKLKSGQDSSGGIHPGKRLPFDALGLALSGAGARGAAFCIGVLQALAKSGWLRHVDYLSTTSGGGYAGGFLGRFFDLLHAPGGLGGPHPNRSPGAAQERVARELINQRSRPIKWLSQYSQFLAPMGILHHFTNLAIFIRNIASIYFLMGAFLFAICGLLNALEYADYHSYGPVWSLLGEFLAKLTPLNHIVPPSWANLWSRTSEVILWGAVVPLISAYWLASQEDFEGIRASVLIALAAGAGALLLVTHSPLGIILFAASLVWVLVAWAIVRQSERHFDPFNPLRLLLVRNRLTGLLSFWLRVSVALVVFSLIDSTGSALARWRLEGGLAQVSTSTLLGLVAGGLLVFVFLFRVIAGVLFGPCRTVKSIACTGRTFSVWILLLVLGVLPPVVALSFVSHLSYECGGNYWQGLYLALGATFIGILLGNPRRVAFINRSGPLWVFGSRLARVFLGAVNPNRRTHPDGENVADVISGDDVSIAAYAPHRAGGPLHIINCSARKRIDVTLGRGVDERWSENFAVGPIGVSVAQNWHSIWASNGDPARKLEPLQSETPHPFLSRSGGNAAVEELSLREWLAISGTTESPKLDRRIDLATRLFLTIANLRFGHWWDSGLEEGARQEVPIAGGLWRSLFLRILNRFRSQLLLLREAFGVFGGPWERYWHLAQAEDFEATGGYELLRRRVPFVIICDASSDGHQEEKTFARLVRLARADFGAEVQEFDVEQLPDLGVPPEVTPHLGKIGVSQSSEGRASNFLASLVRFTFPGDPLKKEGWSDRTQTWLLHISADRTGEEPVEVRSYAATHLRFPMREISGGRFDEAQWETYRRLGEHTGDQLFTRTGTQGETV